MIKRLKLLRNIGQFESAAGGATVALERLSLLYAENGRGKTTLSAILRSLSTGDPLPIAERHRLNAAHPPHVVLECDGGTQPVMFDNNAWNRTLANLIVFDDVFVDANVYSGLVVGSDHRQNLHELILGTKGVVLNTKVQNLVKQIEEQNRAIRDRAAAVPAGVRGSLSVDQFCALPNRATIEEEILAAERQLAAAREQDPIRNAQFFDALRLPALDVDAIERVLRGDLPSLDAAAAARVQKHLAGAAKGAESWIAEGMQRLPQTSDVMAGQCPFCASDLAASPVIAHYRAYFSAEYSELKRAIASTLAALNKAHSGEIPSSFERAVRVVVERREFWSRFGEFPVVNVDTAEIARDWRAAREALATALLAKQAAPLERVMLSAEAHAAVDSYRKHQARIAELNARLERSNETARLVKEQAASGNPTALAADIARLNAVRARHSTEIAAICSSYLDAKAEKAKVETARDEAKAALTQYRTNAFPGFETSLNNYLQRFNAGFRLGQVTATDTRGGPTCTYNVVINDKPVPVAGGEPVPGQPSFRNTLSAGDRNTLALAFFFASLDAFPDLAARIAVIDDPVSSLDDHRTLTTVQEIRRLAQRAAQVIVLSHSKSFLCRVWEGTDRTQRAALRIQRDASGSTLAAWDVDQDSITEHDRRHAALRSYVQAGGTNSREVAESIRPVLEAYLRVVQPEHFPPSTLLGPFRDKCKRHLGTPQEIIDAGRVNELHDLTEYANRFHHDTNSAFATEIINDGELNGFVRRALSFAR